MFNTGEFIATVLSSAGVSATLLVGASWLLRTWIENRLGAGIRHEYDQRLAELSARLKQQGDAATTQLKADMDRLAERLRHSASSFGEVQKATIERRLVAIEDLWRAVIVIQEAVPSGILSLDVLLDEEYLSAIKNPKIGPRLKSIDHYAVINGALEQNKHLAQRRPFISNYLWVIFSTYQAILFRITYLVSQCEKNPEKIRWYTDGLIRKHIQAGLGDQLLKEFDTLRFSRVSWLRDQFNREILSAIESVVAGRESGEAALRQAEKMEEILLESKKGAIDSGAGYLGS